MPQKFLHRCHYSIPPTVSFHRKCRSVHSKNSNGKNDLVLNIFKLKVTFDRLVIRNKIFLESSHHIETHIDVVVEVLEVQRSAAFDLYHDKEFIEFW